MGRPTMLHVRADEKIKSQAKPELKVPNAQTRAAMEEARAMAEVRAKRAECHGDLAPVIGHK